MRLHLARIVNRYFSNMAEGMEESEHIPAYSAKPEEVEQLLQDLDFEYPGSLSMPEGDIKDIIERFAGDAENFISQEYSKFIPEDQLEEIKGNGQRIIVGNLKKLNKPFTEAWLGEKDQRGTPAAFNTHAGRIIFMNHPNHYWNMLTKDNKKELAEKYGSMKEAKEVMGFQLFLYVASHEIVHTFQNQDPDRPVWFLECGASYYTKQVTDKLGVAQLVNHVDDERRIKYQKMIEKYGDTVHQVFYGSLPDKELEQKILTDFNDDEFRQLFPHESKIYLPHKENK
jgi:hypothetical protein